MQDHAGKHCGDHVLIDDVLIGFLGHCLGLTTRSIGMFLVASSQGLVLFASISLGQLPIDDQAASKHEEEDQSRGGPLKVVVDGPVGVGVQTLDGDEHDVGRVLRLAMGDEHHEQTASDLGDADGAAVPLGRHPEVEHLGQREDLGVLGILVPQVFVQVATDARRYLQQTEEDEKGPKQDGQTVQDYLRHLAAVVVWDRVNIGNGEGE